MSASIQGVSFSYHSDPDAVGSAHVVGVEEITLDFPPGSCTLVTGASGSGKSTILKLLNGLIPALYKGELAGTTLVLGQETTKTDIQHLGRCAGMVFQNPRSQFFTSTVLEELAFASENAGDEPTVIADRIADVLSRWGIGSLKDRKLAELSGGELQLVACGAAMAGPQKILLLDEPTSNLSPAAIDAFTDVIRKLKDDGWTLVIAEHRVYPLNGIADRAVVMVGGRVVRDTSGAQFFAMPDEERRALGLRTLTKPESLAGACGAENQSGVRATNLRFSYGKHRVLDIPEFVIPAGSVVALTGANGAGKSTLARTLIGLAQAEKGSQIWFGDKQCNRAWRQKLSQLVMQDVNRQLFAESVAAEVTLGNGVVSEERVAGLLADLGLAGLEDRHPMTLSGGQKQRLVIANALASDAQLYVFDEPTSGVDYQHLIAISSQIRALAALGKSVLVISHDLEFINEVADHQACLAPIAADGEQVTWIR